MSKIRLFERLTELEDPARTAGQTQDRMLRQSVLDHLTRLLNTRAGSVPIDPEYGMPDMSNIAGSFALGTTESLSETLIRKIIRYEPRLRSPRLTVEKEQREIITLRFELQGQLKSSQNNAPNQLFSMTLRINAAGRIHLEPKGSS